MYGEKRGCTGRSCVVGRSCVELGNLYKLSDSRVCIGWEKKDRKEKKDEREEKKTKNQKIKGIKELQKQRKRQTPDLVQARPGPVEKSGGLGPS